MFDLMQFRSCDLCYIKQIIVLLMMILIVPYNFLHGFLGLGYVTC